MPKMYHRAQPRPDGTRKVLLATPTHSGLSAGYTFAISECRQALAAAGIHSELAIFAGDCHVDDARNRLVRDFLETDCDDLVFIDSDIGFEPGALVRLLEYDRDVVAATYPFKQDDEGFPVQFIPGPIRADDDGLVEVTAVPTGFLRIRRHVLERLDRDALHFMPKSDNRKPLPLIFERTINAECRVGGDYTFCAKWRATGGKIYVDPEITLDHYGENQWTGSLGHFQRKELYGRVSAGLLEIKHGLDTPKTHQDIVKGWGNEWSVDAAMLACVVELARTQNKPVLEIGSGISTLAMATANPDIVIHAIEHDRIWIERMQEEIRRSAIGNIVLHYCPLKKYDGYKWYDDEIIPREDFGMVICDGPPRQQGSRKGLFDRCPELLETAILVVDDTNSPRELNHVIQWSEATGRDFHLLGHERQFAVAA